VVDAAVVDELLRSTKRRSDWDYFFSKVETPDWAPLLADRGLFNDPPAPIIEDGYYQFPVWPESVYLARVANVDPRTVLEVIRGIPDTKNPRVQADLLLAMSVGTDEQLRPLLARARRWLSGPFAEILTRSTEVFIRHLIEIGAVDEAVALALRWLSPTHDEVEEELGGGAPSWAFDLVLAETSNALEAVNPDEALRFLMELLSRQIQADVDEERSDASDSSTMWRPAVEEHEQNGYLSQKGLLVARLRDVATAISQDGCELADSVGNRLLQARWTIFKRIAMHVARTTPEPCQALISRLLVNRDNFEDLDLLHEYANLAHDRLGALTLEDRSIVVGWIMEGPDVDAWIETWTREGEEPPPPEEADAFANRWILRRLTPVADYLVGDAKAHYDQLLTEYGAPAYADFVSWMSQPQGFVGPTAPLDAAEVRSMSVDELVTYLADWSPEQSFGAPSPEGMARTLTSVVAGNVMYFTEQATKFQALEPTYVRGFFEGVRQSFDASPPATGGDVNWPETIDLAVWVTSQSSGGDLPPDFFRDVDWTSTRSVLAHLLHRVLANEILPDEYLARAWEVISALAEDPQPNEEFEATYGGSNMDPSTLAINTVRGEAMHAVFAMLARRTEGQAGDERGMPEAIREVLDRHLDPALDPSPSVRSIYGWWFGWTAAYYPDWSEAQVDAIFPLAAESRDLFDAAWTSYITRWTPRYDRFLLLHPQYQLAIDRLGESAGNTAAKGSVFSPASILGQHLVLLYLWGHLTKDDGAVAQYFATASHSLRASVNEYLGRQLDAGRPPEPIWPKLIDWWEARKLVGLAEIDSHRVELGSFGWWSGGATFAPEWWLNQIADLSVAGIALDADFRVVETLATLASSNPSEVLAALREVLPNASTWFVSGHRQQLETIFDTALSSNETGLSDEARALIDLLAARGENSFTHLLG
jgi:hypothetical protein